MSRKSLCQYSQEAEILKMMADEGWQMKDGRTGKAEQSVDVFNFILIMPNESRNFKLLLKGNI
jgi:hypothetical protein